MKPFIIGDRRFAFDVTNAIDLRRLEGAYAVLCAKSEEQRLLAEDAQNGMTASEQMRAIFDLYHNFFRCGLSGTCGGDHRRCPECQPCGTGV